MDTTKATIAKHAHLTQRRRAVPIHGTAQLTYYISEGGLVGFIGTQMITIEAWSGGGLEANT